MKFFQNSTQHLVYIKRIVYDSSYKFTLIRDGLGSILLRICFIFLSFIISIVLARYLKSDGYGIYSYILAIISVLAIPAEFGLPALVIRETSKNLVTRNFDLIKGIWHWSSRIALSMTGLILIVAILGNQIWFINYSDNYKLTFLWGLPLIPLIAFSNLKNAALKGLNKVVLGQLGDNLIRPGIFLALVLSTFFIFSNELSPNLIIGLQSISVGFSYLVGTFLLNYYKPFELKFSKSIQESKKWLSSAFTLAMVNGISLFNKWINVIILGLFTNSSNVGIYNVAIQISILASSGLQAVNLVVAPQFASLFIRGDHDRLQELTTISARVVLVINLLITIFFIFFGRLFLHFIYGPEYEVGYSPMIILLIGQFFNSATGSVAFLLNMTDNEKFTIRGTFVAVGINIILSFILSPKFGINGAAIASATSIAISNIILWWLVYKHLKINSLAFVRLKKKI